MTGCLRIEYHVCQILTIVPDTEKAFSKWCSYYDLGAISYSLGLIHLENVSYTINKCWVFALFQEVCLYLEGK